MKVIIWIGCIFVASSIKVLVFGNANLGVIPTVILYGAFFALARFLCKKWDERKAKDEEHLNQFQQQEKTQNSVQIVSASTPVEQKSDSQNGDTVVEELSAPNTDGFPIVENTEQAQSEPEYAFLLNKDRIVPAIAENNGPIEQYDGIQSEVSETAVLFPTSPNTQENQIELQEDTKESFPNLEKNKLPPIRFCMKCGFELLPDSVFCSKCGTKINR